jgi:hypothetical protein
VREPGRRPRLELEAPADAVVAGEVGAEQLDRNRAEKAAIGGGVHIAHSSPAKARVQLVAARHETRRDAPLDRHAIVFPGVPPP